MSSDAEEITDSDADKIIAEAEMKINGGGGNGGQMEKAAQVQAPVKDVNFKLL